MMATPLQVMAVMKGAELKTLWRLRVPLCDQQPLQQHSAAISAPCRGARRFALVPLHVPASGMAEVSVISINLVI